ncbi:unnamed protein product [Agarophyton chilense]
MKRKQPWNLLKRGETRTAGSALTYAANLALLVTVILEPFLGTKFSTKVFSQLGLQYKEGENNLIPERLKTLYWIKPGTITGKTQILLTTLTKDQVAEYRQSFSGYASNAERSTVKETEKSFALDLRVGEILENREHEESERLFVGRVDVGEKEVRTVVASLRDVYTMDELKGKKVIVVCNLAAANLAGVESQRMILVGEKKKVTKVLSVDDGAKVGQRIIAKGAGVGDLKKRLDRKAFKRQAICCASGRTGK